MRIDAHIAKFRKLDAMLGRLDPGEDCELWIWTAMNAGVHLLNANLHHAGVTTEIDSFHSQVEGLYVVPDRITGVHRDALHPPGDVMHVGQPPLVAPVPLAVSSACEALKRIEDLREPHVRGASPPPPGSAAAWSRDYEQCVSLLCESLSIARV